jgi:NAD(P)-dependent dehydrogenase (short-subunit alcohol dehydrogenase family)
MELTGAVAIVTGGASGLGLATARELAAGGARAVILDLPDSARAAIAREHGLTFVPADVTDEGEVAIATERAAGLGPLRIAVNCAGISSPHRVLDERGVLPLATFVRVVMINLVGTFNVVRLAAERISATEPVNGERGVIVNTASIAAFDGQIGSASYSASKGGVASMTLPLARDLADHLIRVVAVAPGLFATPMLAGLPQRSRDSLAKQAPHPSRLGKPAEFAALVRHIVANPMLNGEVIRLDGALRMAPR